MKIIKVGKYTFMRHWWKWYAVHQVRPDGDVRLERIDFPLKPPTEAE